MKIAMMKFQKLPWIIWITLVCYYVKVEAQNDINRQEILDRYNARRKEIGKKHGFTMWRLKWSDDLAERAKHVAANWDQKTQLENGPDYRVFFTNRDTQPNKKFLELEQKRHDHWKDYDNAIHIVWGATEMSSPYHFVNSIGEAYSNTQREVGCAKTLFRTTYANEEYQYDLLCLIGPESLNLWASYNSRCGEHGYINNDGWCAEDPNNPFPTKPPPPPTTEPPKKKKKKNKKTEEDSDDYEESERKRNREDDEYDLILDLNSVGEKGTVLVFVLVLVMVF